MFILCFLDLSSSVSCSVCVVWWGLGLCDPASAICCLSPLLVGLGSCAIYDLVLLWSAFSCFVLPLLVGPWHCSPLLLVGGASVCVRSTTLCVLDLSVVCWWALGLSCPFLCPACCPCLALFCYFAAQPLSCAPAFSRFVSFCILPSILLSIVCWWALGLSVPFCVLLSLPGALLLLCRSAPSLRPCVFSICLFLHLTFYFVVWCLLVGPGPFLSPSCSVAFCCLADSFLRLLPLPGFCCAFPGCCGAGSRRPGRPPSKLRLQA